jgi:hypothetical protein
MHGFASSDLAIEHVELHAVCGMPPIVNTRAKFDMGRMN